MKIAIGNDHAGVDLKFKIIKHLEEKGHQVKNFGTNNRESVDYPDHIHPVAELISKSSNMMGVIICGSGNGAAMTANKNKNIRAALCWSEEISVLARQHNNANIISIPARYVSLEEAILILEAFIKTPFEGGRHKKRVDKISEVKSR